LVQGAAGLKMFKAIYLDALIQLCQENHILCIADEIMTGFGKTGKFLASEYLINKPDIICLSKALTGGFIPMAATSCTDQIYNEFLDDDINKAFFHGHTFMANPAGAALASLELTRSIACQKRINNINAQHQIFAKKLNKRNDVNNLFILGIILRFDIKTTMPEQSDFYGDLRNFLYQYYIDNKVILRPIGNSVYILPPYCITEKQLAKVYRVILDSLDLVKSSFSVE
jgi:adenosylmethionine-8-amino-7-oxononanoate aminotransferase